MVDPYIEAVSFITKNKDILKEINNKPNLKNKFSEQTLYDYINNLINNIIYNYDEEDQKQVKKSEEMQEEPHRIFNNVLTNLHNLFGGGGIENSGLKSAEINDEIALELFNKAADKDKTIISELFYGRKKVAKFCPKCQMTQYSFIYQRSIDLDVTEYNSEVDLEELINQSIKKEKQKEFCPICSEQRNFKITKTIVEMPKIIIVVIKKYINKIRINYNRYMFNDQYELVGLEVAQTPPKKSIFGLFCKCFSPKPQPEFRLIRGEMIDNDFDTIKMEQPYVLFYQKKDKKKKGKKIKDKKNTISNEESNGINSNINLQKSQRKNKNNIKINHISDKNNMNDN
jgi:rubrerythrin